MPVILFCSDLACCLELQQKIPECEVFAGDDSGELVAILDSLTSKKTGIVLTTSTASKGADFVFAVP
jgi:hypothetical protein